MSGWTTREVGIFTLVIIFSIFQMFEGDYNTGIFGLLFMLGFWVFKTVAIRRQKNKRDTEINRITKQTLSNGYSEPGPKPPEIKECPFCAEIIKVKAIVCRYCGRDLFKDELEDVTQKIVEYYKATKGILTEHVIETGSTGETLNSLLLVESSEARIEEERIYIDRLEAAKRRLQKVKDLNPPNEILAIHQAYIKAFTFGVEARQEESRGNHSKASAAYQISSDELNKTVQMWEELGVT